MKLVSLISVFSFLAGAAFAQSISIEDLQKQINAELATSNQYADLLNNPDPAQSLAAMKVMLRSGDAILFNLALDYGLYSPNPEVRYLALKGYFDAEPLIQFLFDGSGTKASEFSRVMHERYGLGVASDNTGVWSVGVGAYNEELSCYVQRASKVDCLIRHTVNGTMLFTNNLWSRVSLTDDGQLKGLVDISRVGPVPTIIPVN